MSHCRLWVFRLVLVPAKIDGFEGGIRSDSHRGSTSVIIGCAAADNVCGPCEAPWDLVGVEGAWRANPTPPYGTPTNPVRTERYARVYFARRSLLGHHQAPRQMQMLQNLHMARMMQLGIRLRTRQQHTMHRTQTRTTVSSGSMQMEQTYAVMSRCRSAKRALLERRWCGVRCPGVLGSQATLFSPILLHPLPFSLRPCPKPWLGRAGMPVRVGHSVRGVEAAGGGQVWRSVPR